MLKTKKHQCKIFRISKQHTKCQQEKAERETSWWDLGVPCYGYSSMGRSLLAVSLHVVIWWPVAPGWRLSFHQSLYLQVMLCTKVLGEPGGRTPVSQVLLLEFQIPKQSFHWPRPTFCFSCWVVKKHSIKCIKQSYHSRLNSTIVTVLNPFKSANIFPNPRHTY